MVLFSCLSVVILAFLLGVVDASFGMGYGTLLTPILIVAGFDPLQVVSAVLVSQLAGDFLAAFFHHRFRNVSFSIGSRHSKVAMTLSLLGLIGSVIAVVIAASSPKLLLALYIGIVFTVTGLIVLACKNTKLGFSWIRLLCFGSLAAFNKGISGGGYGTIVSVGQILAGEEARSAIGIVSLAEGVTCVAAVSAYIQVGSNIDWTLSVLLSIGVGFSAPLAASIVRRIEGRELKRIIGMSTLLLGLSTILSAL